MQHTNTSTNTDRKASAMTTTSKKKINTGLSTELYEYLRSNPNRTFSVGFLARKLRISDTRAVTNAMQHMQRNKPMFPNIIHPRRNAWGFTTETAEARVTTAQTLTVFNGTVIDGKTIAVDASTGVAYKITMEKL